MQANPHADPFLTTPINPRNYIRAFLGIWAVYGSLLFGMHYFMLDLYVNDFLERNWLAGIESPHKGPISIVCVLVIAHLCGTGRRRVGDAMLTMLAVFPILPMIALYSYRGSAPDYVAMIMAIYIGMWIFQKLNIQIRTPKKWAFIPSRRFINISIGLTIFFILTSIYQGNLSVLNFDFTEVYEYRREATSLRSPQLERLMLYLTGLLVPFSLAMLLKHRDFTRFFALVALTLLLFGLSSQKSYAFIPVFVFLFYYCLRSRLGASALLLGASATILISVLMYLVDEQTAFLATLTTRRMFFVPAYANFLYHDFFSVSSHMYWADSRISLGLVHNPYGMSVPQLIMYVYSDLNEIMRHGVATMGSANANTGFLGAGYAHAGLLGMAIYGLLISGLLSFANVLQKKLGFAAAGAMTSHLFISVFFASSDTLTAFMSYGGVMVPLLAIFIKDEEHVPVQQSAMLPRLAA